MLPQERPGQAVNNQGKITLTVAKEKKRTQIIKMLDQSSMQLSK